MADNLIFPIQFDLEKAVNDAGQQWDKKYAKKLEDYINKRPIKVKLDFESLTDVKTRLAQLKVEPITPETKAAIKELARELQVLAKALEQVKKYSGGVSPDAVRAARINEINQRSADKAAIAHEQARAAAARAEQAEIRLAQARDRNIKSVKSLTAAYKEQSTYLDNLLKRMVAYWGLRQIREFITNVREVTAQFELQRVSLGAIIQDQERANRLFSEIKTFALKSPVSVMDLTKYTKQIAAYGVETEKLFDTTKMLTDVSVGLGTPLSQLALAFGQIRSSSVLRLAETRQLTEAGIPALELLAKQLEKTYGRFVSTAEVMELISKRAISFEMVEQMFKDMTSAGGMFYQMQEKQGNTLFGMWAKLGDAASVMYDEIGNTESVNSGMRASIALLTTLMKNWKLVGGEMMIVAATMGVIYAKSKAHATATALQAAALNKVRTAGIAYNAILAQEAKLTTSATIAQKASIAARKANAKAALDAAIAERTAANATNVWTRSMNKLKAAFMGNWVTILIAAIAAMGVAIYNAVEKANRLKNTLNSIETERITQTAQSVRNFEYLADAAVKAADGSKEQKDALDELQRTYSDMIPVQDLTIEKLRAMHGNYQSLTTAIKEYIAKQQKQKKLSAIEEEYGNEITDKYKKLSEKLIKGVDINVGGSKIKSWVHLQFSAEEFERAINELEKRATDKTKSLRQKLKESFEAIGHDLSEDQVSALLKVGKWGEFDDGYFVSLNNALEEQAERIEAVQKASAKSVGDLGRYKDTLDDITESVKKYRMVHPTTGKAIERDTFLFQQGQQNFQIKQWANSIKSDLESAGVTIQEGIFNLVDKINENDPTKISTIDFTKLMPMLDSPEVKQKLGNSYETFKNYVLSIQKLYDGIVPSDPIVQAVRNKLYSIGNATKGGMDVMKKYLWDGKTSIEEHLKTLKASSDTLQAELYKYANYIKQYGILGKAALLLRGIDYDALAAEYDALTKQIEYVQTYVKEKDSNKSRAGTKSDNRLQNLQEIEQTLTKINQKYDELAKKEGQIKALEDINKLYANTLKYVNKLGKQFKLSFKIPTEFKDLQDYRKAILDVINTLKMKGYQKAALDLEEKIGTGNLDALQKQIEKQLKALSDRISRTKTAKEFYEKILGQTGNRDMAARLATSIFGENGEKLNKEIAERMRKMVEGTSATMPDFVFNADMSVNSKALRGWVEANKTALGDVAKELTKFADESEKDTAKMIEGWLKATEKAKTYGDKLADVYRTTTTEIARIEAEMAKGNLGRDIGTELIAGYRRKEAEEVAKLQYEAFKDSPMYVQMFDDLDHASTRMLENMKSRLESLQGAWRNLDPTQLKEMQSRLREIDEQLAKRNPFKVMADGLREYTRLRTKGDARGNTSRANADRDATEWAEKYLEAQEELAKITSDPTATEAQIEGARQMVDYTKRQKDEAEKTAANWKKVEDAIGLSANQLMQMLNWGGDIAHAIADISEAMGADEEDVQYWNDIASGLDEVSGAIQDIVSAAMSGNVVGVISSALTAIPKMFVGFANIFAAGKIKRANKEIKRQQELIEALEYSYSRLEKAAEKTFGADYLRNVNERLRMLKAEAEAYRKQAEAERSKGKKCDKEAEKEYLEHARDTADEIEELNRELQEKITGTTVEKAAEDFANAWLDAYLSFGNTAEAIKEKFRDMMKTMVVNMALSGVVERMIKPLMDMIDERAADGELSSREIAEIMGAVPGYVDDIDNAMTVAMEALKAAGVDVGQLRDATDAETRGIAKGVASATSEEINAATAVGKTLLYYASPIPRIDENLARVVAIMESRGIASPTASGTTTGVMDYTGMFNTANQHLSSLPRMEQHLAEIHTMLGRALKTKGSTTGFNTFLN